MELSKKLRSSPVKMGGRSLRGFMGDRLSRGDRISDAGFNCGAGVEAVATGVHGDDGGEVLGEGMPPGFGDAELSEAEGEDG